jgi:glycine/D-amino acid oxidase-like deaminating enzyme
MLNLSFWEQQSWFNNVEFCIVGSGIVGLSCALQLRKKHPRAKILVLEKGILPQGASTKNAGFACFGSASELLSDLKNHNIEDVINLVKQRVDGLELLKSTLGEKNIDFQQHGGYEVFQKKDQALYETCASNLNQLNEMLEPVFHDKTFDLKTNNFGFENCLPHLIFNPFEGQIDTGKMMQHLLQKAQSEGILILNSTAVTFFSSQVDSIDIELKDFNFKSKHLFIATNAFARELLDLSVTPARNQVLITQPISDLHIKGTFHLDEGFYYFRNINNRILLGGGRNLDSEAETTAEFGTTQDIQNALEQLLKEVILPEQDVKIDVRWSGILGVGKQKKPIVKAVSSRVFCAVRLGGMGVAIGSSVGKQMADLIS